MPWIVRLTIAAPCLAVVGFFFGFTGIMVGIAGMAYDIARGRY